MENGSENWSVRVLCRKLIITSKEPGLQWLIGSPFFPPFTIVSTFRCLHTQSGDPFSPDYTKESGDLRALLLRGFDVIGALLIGNSNWEANAGKAANAAFRMRNFLSGDDDRGNCNMIGAVADSTTGDIRFFVSRSEKSTNLEVITTVLHEDNPEKYICEKGCLLRCELAMNLPIYVPVNRPSDAAVIFSSATEAVVAKFKDPKATYIVEGVNATFPEISQPFILRGAALDYGADLSDSDTKPLSCSYFCSKSKPISLDKLFCHQHESCSATIISNADTIQVNVLLNKSGNSQNSGAPVAEYFPASEPAKLLVVSYKLDVLCYAVKDLPVAYAVSKLIIPGLVDQLNMMNNSVLPNLVTQHPQLRPYHFCPPGVLHPITVLYELSYGEIEMKQGLFNLAMFALITWGTQYMVEIRKSIHLRLGLPLDRPLLLTANALNFSMTKDSAGRNSIRKGSALLKDVHTEIPSSGVSGGLVSLVEGSYEYYHYLQDDFDDSGWGCAYRSLQTIISWFRLQHYTSIEVPSHREIQQALVEIGDKEPSFNGSREWIGAIELSFVLDKLLGVSCKVINVRSGAELPEKCRELAFHFETQGTPVMIGGGVLAYTLLGVHYNEASGDCAFLILDPHYTGNDELKKIVNGGWCGWKKAVDSKGRNFFLHDKFYNLLLPQRPNMV
ncbi:hypothetical protein HHK36_025080 [Tetracentron sinense]|uniref:Probable Ufm1-specific protease n=1 Tax=Tetracentron sinense TaxID=13715 RepID=A0A835D4V2_TETSI|nr:hypothetical protein HHK36_025080 [Tetracentron sinense]